MPHSTTTKREIHTNINVTNVVAQVNLVADDEHRHGTQLGQTVLALSLGRRKSSSAATVAIRAVDEAMKFR